MENITLRTAAERDAEALLEIYRPYVENTAISFEYDVPSVGEFRRRIGQTLKKYPYLLAQRGEEILGYAYASPFHPRAAYDWAAEASIYVKLDARGQGVGKLLYAALERALILQGVLNLEACISVPGKDDEYLDHSSQQFHQHMGFRLVGKFEKCGYKFGRWYDMIWMEKFLAPHRADQPPVKTFAEIEEQLSFVES